MRKFILLAIPFTLAAHSAVAGSASGGAGLALAALVALQSPSVGAANKAVMGKMLDGKLGFSFPAGKKINIDIDALDCRAGDVDISAHTCDMTFGSKTVSISGRKANELFDALSAAGIPGDGSAGQSHESFASLKCVIDPNEVKQKAGGGASCDYN